jgi:5-methyltetrahydropteroyltriglutamate--homocysteine methyltransferase
VLRQLRRPVIQAGTWGKLIDYLNALEVDHIVMETAHRPRRNSRFRSLRPRIGFGLGVIDIKSTESSAPIPPARSNEPRKSGPGRVTYVHPDCGFWMLKRNIADGKLRALVAGRDRYEGLRR